ncbi:hypothetical protein [Actinoplanes sp. NPDC049118]|uniref:hypothetical protein n=1 Tax=Actinoplanes sp. NPDC049118 TaxID=3155769 RepID=UPI0033F90188
MTFTSRPRRLGIATAAALLTLLLVPDGVRAESGESAVCPATSLALTTSYPPIRVDPKAGYPLWWFRGGTGTEHFGLVVEADFPYAAWTSWSTYRMTGTLPVTNVLSRTAIAPEPGGTNPYVAGNPVMAPQRRFRILVVPEGTTGRLLPDGSMIAAGLQGIDNRLFRITDADWLLAERIYAPFPGYDRIGRGGPTATPPPTVTAVDLITGAALDCANTSVLPGPLVRPSGRLGQVDNRIPALFALTNLDLFQRLDLRQFYPPKPDRRLVEFFRPGFSAVPLPDMPTYPSPEQCGTLLVAKLQQDQIALIRIPKLPRFFDTTKVGPDTRYPAPDVDFVSLNNYGFDLGLQLPRGDDPLNMSRSQADLRLDGTGGMTLVVWPRRGVASLPAAAALILAKAQANGWNLQQGNIDGPYFPHTEVVRYKGTNPTYRYSFTPNDVTRGVPCFYNDPANADVPFEDIPQSYAARPAHTGPATPQGVQCTLTEFLSDTCLSRLKQHIADTGGSYYASSAEEVR